MPGIALRPSKGILGRIRGEPAPLQPTRPNVSFAHQLWPGDCLTLLLAGFVASVLTGNFVPRTNLSVLGTLVAMAGIIAVLLTSRAYEIQFPMAGTTSTYHAMRVLLWTVPPGGALWFAFEPRVETVFAVFCYGIIAIFGMTLNRVIVFPRVRAAAKSRVVVCGLNGDAVCVAQRFATDQDTMTPTIVGLLTPEAIENQPQRPRLGSWEDMQRLFSIGMFDEVVFSVPQSSPASLPLAATAVKHRIPFRFEPHERGSHFSPRDHSVDLTIEPPMGKAGRAIKRAVDLVGATLLLVVTAPLYLAIAVMIKRDSQGPVLFAQKRVGLHGKLFTMYKFRTMTLGTSAYDFSPREGSDSRVTRAGRFLRRTSLDELPQLINVIRGEMSLVGPRPEMPFIVGQYGPLEDARHKVKPGMTGIWQTSRHRNDPIHENIHYDLFYVQNQSLILDLVILTRTAFLAFRGV